MIGIGLRRDDRVTLLSHLQPTVSLVQVFYELAWERRIRHAQREFNTVRDMTHPSVLSFIELVIRDDIIFATMEIMSGGELLDHIVPDIGLALENVVTVMDDICSGLQFIHEKRGIVHLDVKPENVCIAPSSSRMIVYKRCESIRGCL